MTGTLRRYQASQGPHVTNLRHESVRLGDLERHLLGHLDGTADVTYLVDALTDDVQQGRMIVQQNGQNVSDRDHMREIVSKALPNALSTLCRKGLLRAT